MSEKTYICPFRKYTENLNTIYGELFMPCDFEKCSFCSIGETDTSKTYYCEYPNSQKTWQIKREIK